MDLKEKVALLFEITFSAKTTDDLLAAQQNLALLKSDSSFLKTIFEIIADSNKDPETKTRLKSIKKAATLFLKKFVDEKLDEDDLKHDEIYYMAQVICDGIHNPNISARNKIQFIIILNNLMLNDLSKTFACFYFKKLSK